MNRGGVWIRRPALVGAAVLGLASAAACSVEDDGRVYGQGAGTGGVSDVAGAAGEGSGAAGETSGGAAGSHQGGAAGSSEGGAGGALEPSSPGDSCDEEGTRRCAEPASDTVLGCTDGSWTQVERCGSDELCDSANARCRATAEGCSGRDPGDAFCDGDSRVVCGPDLVSLTEETCTGRCLAGECVGADCGDGTVQSDEECDDGDDDDTDECPSTCREATCGDGFVLAGDEECDDGNDDDEDECPTTCEDARCGDGFTQRGEEACDDGNDDDADSCLSSCEPASCGDGTLQSPEECDDENQDDTDDCPSTCTAARCGDGFVWAGEEECDDQNTASGDGCSSQCRAEVVELALGERHSCARFGDGRLKCWGDNRSLQLGPGNDPAVGDEPIDIGPNLGTVLEGVSDVAAGSDHTCALQSGDVKCWGSNGGGQLGPDGPASSAEPVTIPLPRAATQISGGGRMTAALLTDGTVWVWGDTSSGAVTMSDGIVALPLADRAELIEADEMSMCALLENGSVSCYGYGWLAGQPIRGLEDHPADIVALSLSGNYACALDAAKQATCWGYAFGYHQLGNEDNAREGQSEPMQAWPPAPLEFDVEQLSSRGGVTCAFGRVGSADRLLCWGYDWGVGALALPEITTDPDYPGVVRLYELPANTAIDLGPISGIRSIATSGRHSCVLLTDGRVKCWGDNEFGQLGLGTTETVIGEDAIDLGSALPYATLY